MGLIKSAWEIAMEKTKDIQVDAQKIAHDAKVQAGRKLAAAFLSDSGKSLESLSDALEKVAKEEKSALIEGILAVTLDNLTLPQNKEYQSSLTRLRELASVLKNPSLDQGLMQIGQIFEQYLQQKDAIVEQAKEQYAPRLQQKVAQLRQQYGQEINLQPEQDPDFLKMLDSTLKNMDARYNAALTQFKEQIKAMFQN